jgi:hypothetical protein
MDAATRNYLATIGRKGGTRSRRTLTPEQARRMVLRREGKRAVREFERSGLVLARPALPGIDVIESGMRDLAEQRSSIQALQVSIAAPRLRLLGLRLPEPLPDPEERLFAQLAATHGNGAHSRYNAMIRRLVSFARVAAQVIRAPDRHSW